MKKSIAIIMTVVVLLTLCACGGTSTSTDSSSSSTSDTASVASDNTTENVDDTVYNLKWASTESTDSIRYQYLEKPLMDLITEKTNGRITFTFYASSSLVGSAAIIKGCQDGTCDIGSDNINSYPGVFLYSELMATPGVALGDTFDEKADNIQMYVQEYEIQEFADNDIYLIGTAPALDVVLMSTFEVTSLDSYKSKTVCCNSSYAKMFEDYGAAVTWVVVPEWYESLHLNIIDAAVNGAGPLSAMTLYEVLDYAYYIPFATVTSTYVMSLDVYNSLPAELQAILDEIQNSDEFIDINREFVSVMMDDVMNTCFENNEDFVMTDLPDDVSDAMYQSCEENVQDKVAELASAGLDADGAYALLMSFSE